MDVTALMREPKVSGAIQHLEAGTDRILEEAVRDDPKNLEARVMLAQAYQADALTEPAMEQLQACFKADPRDVETNLVRVDVRKSGHRAAQWSADLKAKGVLVAPADIFVLRFVTHRHISAPDVDAAVGAFAELWKKR